MFPEIVMRSNVAVTPVQPDKTLPRNYSPPVEDKFVRFHCSAARYQTDKSQWQRTLFHLLFRALCRLSEIPQTDGHLRPPPTDCNAKNTNVCAQRLRLFLLAGSLLTLAGSGPALASAAPGATRSGCSSSRRGDSRLRRPSVAVPDGRRSSAGHTVHPGARAAWDERRPRNGRRRRS